MFNSNKILSLLGRNDPMFTSDFENSFTELSESVRQSKFLVIGAAGSIGQAVTKEIFSLGPRVLHAVDISENNMVELVRDIRSTKGYSDGDFRTFALDCGTDIFESFVNAEGPYDYILNLSALKHVRSEKDPFTLMRMIDVNILNTIKTIDIAKKNNSKKYFCVSTDKAANPVNMMGASKRIMEMFLMKESQNISLSTARFANVAFSDGSLLHGFNQRFIKRQPFSAPSDVRRYFVTPKESGQLCLMSCILGSNRDIFFPKLSEDLDLTTFSSIAIKYLNEMGYEPYECSSEKEARDRMNELIKIKKWPCYFFKSDTTGEKDFEEFYTNDEEKDLKKFMAIGIVKNKINYSKDNLDAFLREIQLIRNSNTWDKKIIVDIFNKLLPNFDHVETGKYLDQKM